MNASTCGGGFCRHDPACSDLHCEGHPRQTEEYDEREERLSVAMNQPITRDDGMQVSFEEREPIDWEFWSIWIAVVVAFAVVLILSTVNP